MSRIPRTPSYRLHKPSGQAVVTLLGRDYYLGKHGSPESEAEYRRVVAEWLAGGATPPAPSQSGLSVSEILDRYWTYATVYYRQVDPDSGKSVHTPHQYRVKKAIDAVRALYGHTEARRFGPVALQAIRSELVRKYARRQVNSLVGCIVRAFRWACANELIPGSVLEGLRSVEGLRAGRTEARETPAVLPVPEDDIPPIRPLVLPVVWDLVQLQLRTAARPGELLGLRPAELDRSGSVWVFTPRSHKTAYQGRQRRIWFGPQAQGIVAPYLLRDAASYCFSPREAVLRQLREQGREERTNAGNRYSVSSYVRAIRNACEKAGVRPFRAHRLRHNAATRIVNEYGWEIGRLLLGHAHLDTTKIYAEADIEKVLEVVRKIG